MTRMRWDKVNRAKLARKKHEPLKTQGSFAVVPPKPRKVSPWTKGAGRSTIDDVFARVREGQRAQATDSHPRRPPLTPDK